MTKENIVFLRIEIIKKLKQLGYTNQEITSYEPIIEEQVMLALEISHAMGQGSTEQNALKSEISLAVDIAVKNFKRPTNKNIDINKNNYNEKINILTETKEIPSEAMHKQPFEDVELAKRINYKR